MEIFSFFGKIVTNAGETENDIKNVTNTAKDSEGKMTKSFANIGNAIQTAGKWVLGIGAAAGAVAIKLGKEVISAFGDYEQLVGGIDTLFKDSSGKMQEYAANAYMTAGLSANDYMETVTGFSASLISSLGGDTEKAVQYADMAITDMSDNANKMGSSMESIQNAYQGFAKQNYTMLDNLKLGYGGTKEEMERLLADATAISGITYDVSSYADVVDAIHVIQVNMDIAGTTALEAEDTIQGAVGSFKSAFDNLIVGLGNADADMEVLMGNVVSTFENVVKNITPIIANIAKALPEAFGAMLPVIGELLPDLLATVANLFQQVLEMLIKILPELIPVAVDAVMLIVDTLVDNLPLLIDAAITLIMALTEGLMGALPKLIPAVIAMIVLIVTELIKRIPEILEFVPVLFKELVKGFKEVDWATLGADLVKGIWNGITGTADWLGKKVKGFIDGIKNIFTGKDGFDTHSPSKVSEQWGKWIDEGLAIGIEVNEDIPLNAIETLADKMANAAKEAVERTNEIIAQAVSVTNQAKAVVAWEQEREKLEKKLNGNQNNADSEVNKHTYVGSPGDRQSVDEKGFFNQTKNGAREIIMRTLIEAEEYKNKPWLSREEGTYVDGWENSEKGKFWTKELDKYEITEKDMEVMKKVAQMQVTQNITINSPTALSPSETARQVKNASKELAMGV